MSTVYFGPLYDYKLCINISLSQYPSHMSAGSVLWVAENILD